MFLDILGPFLLGPFFGCSEKGDETKIVSFVPKGGESNIFNILDISLQRGINRSGKKDNDYERRKTTLSNGKICRQRPKDEVQTLRKQIGQTQAKIDAFDEKHESEGELQRLEILKKILNLILKTQKQSFWR